MPECNREQHTPVFISGSGYSKWSRCQNPREIKITNFLIETDALIEDENKWWFTCKITDDTGEVYENVLLGHEVFMDAKPFKKAVGFSPNLLFKGDAQDVTEIKAILALQNPCKKFGVSKNGMHFIRDCWVYVEEDLIIDKKGRVDDIVYVGRKEAKSSPGLLTQRDLSDLEVQQLAQRMFNFNAPAVVYPTWGWIGYCFIKERLGRKGIRRNPYLVFQGFPGSGKTDTAASILCPMFGLDDNAISLIGYNTTKTFAVSATRSNLIPTIYDEYKDAIMTKAEKRAMQKILLAIHDQTSYRTGKSNESLNELECTAPTVIIGEMTIDSPAQKHRMVDVYFSPEQTNGHEVDYFELIKMPLGALGKALLLHSMALSDNILQEQYDYHYSAVKSDLKNRHRESAALVRTGLWLILNYFQSQRIAISEHEKGYAIIDEIISGSAIASRETNVDRIISDFALMSRTPNGSGNWLRDGYHYEVRDNHLYLRTSEVYSLYQQFAKGHHVQAESLPKSSFLQQIRSTVYFVRDKAVRIGPNNVNGLRLDISLMPDHIDTNFHTTRTDAVIL